MKMKDACAASGLTERAVRLYVSKGLCSPGQKNGYLDFTADDVRRLMDVACLRQLDFSIEQIHSMIEDPDSITDILFARIDEAQAAIGHEQDVLDTLIGMRATSVRTLVRKLEAGQHIPTGPDFSRIDGLSSEEKKQIALESSREYRLERRIAKAKRIVMTTVLVCSALVLILVSLSLSFTRFSPLLDLILGNNLGMVRQHARIDLPVVQILHNENNEYLTIHLIADEENSENGDTFMVQHIITVEARLGDETRALIPRLSQMGQKMLQVGYVFSEDCEPVLIMNATIWDFLRLGYEPFPLQHVLPRTTVRALLEDLCDMPVSQRNNSLTIEIPGLKDYVVELPRKSAE